MSVNDIAIDDEKNAHAVLEEKFIDSETPGFDVEFDPLEADKMGAFVEDALTESEAKESYMDLTSISGDRGDG